NEVPSYLEFRVVLFRSAVVESWGGSCCEEGTRRRPIVQQSAAFFEPGAAPRFDHGVRFVLVKTLGNEHSFQFPAEIADRAREFRWIQDGIFLQPSADSVTHFFATALEKNGIGNLLLAVIFDM